MMTALSGEPSAACFLRSGRVEALDQHVVLSVYGLWSGGRI